MYNNIMIHFKHNSNIYQITLEINFKINLF